MTAIYSGLEMAAALNVETRRLAGALTQPPRAVVLFAPGDSAMEAYASRQRAMAAEAGIEIGLSAYAEDASAVRDQLRGLAGDDDVDAVAALYPLPSGLAPLEVALLIGPDKDADGIHPLNVGLLGLGANGVVPATAAACLRLAEALLGPLRGREIAIVGASRIVGRPLAALMLDREATMRIGHAATRDLAALTRDAELIVTSAGVPGLIGRDHVGQGACVIDVSIRRVDGRLVGDVDLDAVRGIASIVTHVPDGVGPVTTACLLRNVARAAARRRGDG